MFLEILKEIAVALGDAARLPVDVAEGYTKGVIGVASEYGGGKLSREDAELALRKEGIKGRITYTNNDAILGVYVANEDQARALAAIEKAEAAKR